ncbi:MAG: DedA family protein, partial [bacterium]|nr:DedA family protein [bacterium]
IPLVLGARKKWFRLALIVSVASVLGGAFGYAIGRYLWWSGPETPSALAEFFFANIPGFSRDIFDRVMNTYETNGFVIVFTAGFTFIPFKIFTISSGVFQLNFLTFMLASLVSRSARFFLVSFLIYRFGEPIKEFIDKYFNRLALVFAILLIGGFLLIKGGL